MYRHRDNSKYSSPADDGPEDERTQSERDQQVRHRSSSVIRSQSDTEERHGSDPSQQQSGKEEWSVLGADPLCGEGRRSKLYHRHCQRFRLDALNPSGTFPKLPYRCLTKLKPDRSVSHIQLVLKSTTGDCCILWYPSVEDVGHPRSSGRQ